MSQLLKTTVADDVPVISERPCVPADLLYKVTFTPTALDEYFTYAECVDFFGREEFKDVLKGINPEATAYPVDIEE